MSQIIAKLTRNETLAKLPEDIIWSNLSERGMNKVIPPVLKKKTGEVSFPIEWIDKWGNICKLSNGYWGKNNYTVMDVVGYMLVLKEGGDALPENSEPIFNDLESIKIRESQLKKPDRNGELQQPEDPIETQPINLHNYYSIGFDDSKFREYTGLKLSSNDILELLLETSRVEFKLTFPVIVKSDGAKQNLHPMNYFSRFFELGYSDQKVRKDGIVQMRRYRVTFNTILGELFVNNLLSWYNDKVDIRFYTLPDSAQLFYRRKLLHHNYDKTECYLNTIAECIGLTDKNITNLISTVEFNVLEPLKEYGLITSYEKTKSIKGIKYTIKRM